MDPQKQYNVFLCRTADDSNNSRYNPKYEVGERKLITVVFTSILFYIICIL